MQSSVATQLMACCFPALPTQDIRHRLHEVELQQRTDEVAVMVDNCDVRWHHLISLEHLQGSDDSQASTQPGKKAGKEAGKKAGKKAGKVAIMPHGWLSDEVLNSLMVLLAQRSAAAGGQEQCIFFQSFFMEKLQERGEYDFNRVKRWTINEQRKSGNLPNDYLKHTDSILMPYNILNTHWVLLVVRPKEQRLLCYDSSRVEVSVWVYM